MADRVEPVESVTVSRATSHHCMTGRPQSHNRRDRAYGSQGHGCNDLENPLVSRWLRSCGCSVCPAGDSTPHSAALPARSFTPRSAGC
jgi:hypothetical protein